MRKILPFLIIFIFIVNRNKLLTGLLFGITLFRDKVFPSLFLSFIFNDYIISTNIPNIICDKFGNYYQKIFKVKKITLFINIISILTGTPNNVKLLKDLYDKKIIDITDINKALSYNYLINPFFLISFINIKYYLIYLLSNFLTGILIRNKYVTNESKENIKLEFKFNLFDSINKNIESSLKIMGVIIFFSAINNIIYLPIPSINYYLKGILEITSSLYIYKNKFKNLLYLSLILNLGGISLFMQTKSILKDANLDYKFIFSSRILSVIIMYLICFIT